VATDYDTPRTTDTDDDQEQSLEALKARRAEAAADLGDDADPFEVELDLPGADLSAEELTVRVLPRQADEFTCTSCYLVHHRSQLADQRSMICSDCAA
jgi:HSP20 family molecular chaperone IbpA